jgi:hypothetical protein
MAGLWRDLASIPDKVAVFTFESPCFSESATGFSNKPGPRACLALPPNRAPRGVIDFGFFTHLGADGVRPVYLQPNQGDRAPDHRNSSVGNIDPLAYMRAHSGRLFSSALRAARSQS